MGSTWPLATQLGESIPLGTEAVSTVPLFNVWTLWWNADRLAHLGLGYWNAPIFHPEDDVFAFSEPQPLTGLVAAPIVWGTGDPGLAYGLVLLLGLTLNGVAAYGLLRTVGLSVPASLAGGVLVQTIPFVFQELGVLQLVTVAGILWTLQSLLKLRRRPSTSRGAVLGAAFVATFLTCAYYGLMTFLVLVVAAPVLLGCRRLRAKETWKALLAVAAVGMAGLVPVVWVQLRATAEHDFDRSVKTVSKYAAEPVDYVTAPWPPRVPAPGVDVADSAGDRAFFPGTLKVLWASWGVLWIVGRRRREPSVARFSIFLGLVGGVAFVLSLGPELLAGRVYEPLAAVVPGFAALRSLFRFAVFVQLVVALAAALGVEAVIRGLRTRASGRGMSRLAPALVAILVLLGAWETWPGSPPLQPLPSLDRNMAWLEYLEDETPADAVLAFLPFPRGTTSRAYRGSVQWMYWQMRHGRSMVNGYSGHFPDSFLELKKSMGLFPAPEAFGALRSRGVDHVVMLRRYASPEAVASHPVASRRLELVQADPENGVDVYRLR